MRRLLAILVLTVCVSGCGATVADEQPSARSVSLHVEGMMCEESCAKSVERILAAQTGIEQVVVDFERKQATCKVDPETFDAEAALAELADQDFVAAVER